MPGNVFEDVQKGIGNVYDHADVFANKVNPKIIAKYHIDVNGNYRIHYNQKLNESEQSEINKILDQCNAKIHELPIILRTDAIAKRLRMAPGDICKINRITQTGEIPFYRVCK